jgi:hypothetical protein
MTYRGSVKNGVVVLERGAKLAEGTAVRVQPTVRARTKKRAAAEGSLGKRLMKFAGSVKGLPKDLARNHDHYIHGTPRK